MSKDVEAIEALFKGHVTIRMVPKPNYRAFVGEFLRIEDHGDGRYAVVLKGRYEGDLRSYLQSFTLMVATTTTKGAAPRLEIIDLSQRKGVAPSLKTKTKNIYLAAARFAYADFTEVVDHDTNEVILRRQP
jgi:hypothetical protein